MTGFLRQPRRTPSGLFRSFWMGGYEGADHVNGCGVALRLNDWNGHWSQTPSDYAQLARLGVRTLRESIGWRACTGGDGHPRLFGLRDRAEQAQAQGLQVIWTIHHYGVPPGVDLFSADFTPRFAEFCYAVSHALSGVADGPSIYQPVNEISFLSWAATSSGLIHPYEGNSPERGYELKCRLVEATLRACDAIWAQEADARMVHTDPIVHTVAPLGAGPEAVAEAESVRLRQFEAWDMLCGHREPSLGGAPRYLDILGANYYHGNQWEHPSQQPLHWHLRDERRRSLDDMLAEIWTRYQRPLFIAETGHVGAGRAPWLDDVAAAALRAMQRGVPLEGICVYPLVDRTDWEEPSRWHHSGLWETRSQVTGVPVFTRVLHEPLAQRLRHWQTLLPPPVSPANLPTPGFPRSRLIPQLQGALMSPLIVFSHLRWDFVYQRPQQLLSRMAALRPVIFVEEPVVGSPYAQPTLERMQPCKGVEVLRCHLPGTAQGFVDENISAMKTLLAQYIAQQGLQNYWLWFYTPMAVPLAAQLQPDGVVYDCMDELSAFRFAPPELLLREEQLFAMADLVFTGGHSLFDAKRQRHADVSCFPSSVDAAHYARPQVAGTVQAGVNAPPHDAVAHPRLGYCGVIDERVDLALIEAVADARPDWQLAMVGPVVKIDPASLPRRANIHWLGQRDYADLPALIHGWDVCLMPFARNESTRFISPTKTLEYLAAGCPVVSTPIHDVVTSYPGIVAIAESAPDFVAACHAALNRTPADIQAQAAAVERLLQRTSWDRTAAAMTQLMTEVDQANAGQGGDTVLSPSSSRSAPSHAVRLTL